MNRRTNVSSLSDILKVLKPYLSLTIINKDIIKRLMHLSEMFPAVLCFEAFGFETLLSCPSSEIDFAFAIEGKKIGKLIQAVPPVRKNQNFFESNEAKTLLKNLWLEYNLSTGKSPLPRFFFGLRKYSLSFIKRLLNQFLSREKQEVMIDRLSALISRLPPYADIFQIGLSSCSEEVRICVKNLSINDMDSFAGLMEPVLPLLPGFPREIKPLVFHFNLNNDSYLGIEWHLPVDPFHPANQKLWVPFLTHLTANGLCTKEKQKALTEWPGRDYEYLCPELAAYSTDRYLYYVKVNLFSGEDPAWKGYFGFLNKRLPLSGEKRIRTNRTSSSGYLNQIFHKGISYLRNIQHSHGAFPSFSAPDPELKNCKPESSPFITALILQILNSFPSPQTERMIKKGVAFLLSVANKNLLWHYWTDKKEIIPPDADDTACISFLLKRLGYNKLVEKNRTFFLQNRDTRGLFQTWFEPGGPNDCDSVVNANVLLYLGDCPETRIASEYLYSNLRVQWEECSYWYYLHNLSLYYFLSRAIHFGVTSLNPAKKLILQRIKKRYSSGTPLLSALAVNTLFYSGASPGQVKDRVFYLAETVNKGGFWEKEAFYQGPRPGNPPSVWFGSDALTTSLCIGGIGEYLRRS